MKKIKNEILNTYIFTLPYILVEFTNVFLVLIDKSISNSLGKTAIIVFSSFVTLNWAINTIQGCLGSAHSVVLARDKESAKDINTTAMVMELISSIIIAIFLFIFAKQITYIYTLEDTARETLIIILKLKAIQLPILALQYVPENLLKIKKQTKLIWIAIIVSSVINIAGDLISVKLGFNEVGIYCATIISTIVCSLLLLIFANIKRGHIIKKHIVEILNYAKDLIFNKIIQRIVNILYTSIASSFGSAIYAIHCVCIAITDTLSETLSGYQSGLLINYSNDIENKKEGLLKKVDKVGEYGIFIGIIVILILIYPTWFVLGRAVSWTDCLPYIWFYQLEFISTLCSTNYSAYLLANKDTKPITFMALIGGICVRIPFTYLTKYLNWGLLGLSFACGIDRAIRTIYLRMYIRNNKKIYK